MTKRIAILTDLSDPYSPSDLRTLQYLKELAARRRVEVEFLVHEDIHRLHTFDGLFIRCTTNINNYTFQWIQYAEHLGINMVDSSRGCALGSDKFLQHMLLTNKNISTPKTIVVYPSSDVNLLIAQNALLFPLVLKIVNGCSSVGVYKVATIKELQNKCEELFTQQHHCLLLQEYTPTDLDWRIGILNKQIIFACKYFMSKDHWQVCKYNEENTLEAVGPGEPIDIGNIPASILHCVKQTVTLLDKSIYGLDIKLINNKAYVIEINDNPNLNYDMEDRLDKDEIYNKIIDKLIKVKSHRKIVHHQS